MIISFIEQNNEYFKKKSYLCDQLQNRSNMMTVTLMVTTRVTQRASISVDDATSAHFRPQDTGGDTTRRDQLMFFRKICN